MIRLRPFLALCVCAPAALALGCGTTRWSDTARTGTEQMLMADAIERSVSQMDFAALAGQPVYLDGKYIAGMVDEKYVMSTLRQHMFATGCVVRDKPEDATYVVEIRAGALGTNRSDVLFGVPATNLPAGGAFIGAPTAIPELPLIKRTAQQGVCKLAVFAYDRTSGAPVWQSGTRQQISKAKDVWVFGTGPFQHGTIYDGTKFAGEKVRVPLFARSRKTDPAETVAVTQERVFPQTELASVPARLPPDSSATPITAPSAVIPASATSPIPAPPAAAPAAAPMNSGTSSSTSSVNTSGNGLSSSAPAASATPPASQPNTSTMPNAAAGAMGAMQVVDWARTVRTH